MNATVKIFSSEEILTSLSTIYRKAIKNGGSKLQNTTYLFAVLLVLTLRLADKTAAGKTRVLWLTAARQVSCNR